MQVLNKNRCLIIAEVAQSHEGSLGMAHTFIDAIAKAGADAVKFQTHIAVAESTPQEPWRVRFSSQDKTRFDYWKRMEFTKAQWSELKKHAESKGLLFLSSPFSIEAVQLLRSIGIKAWKIPSGEINNLPMIESILKTKLPILLSTGMSPLKEVDQLVKKIQKANVSFSVLQCTSVYPCPPEKLGLNIIPFYQKRYRCPVGLSDHSGTIYAGLAAAALGAQVLEVHATFSRALFGPDVPSSITMEELRQLVEGVRFIEKTKKVMDKNALAKEVQSLRKIFMKSIVAKKDLPAGTVLRKEHLVFKKPGKGIPPYEYAKVIGYCLKRKVRKDQIIFKKNLKKSSFFRKSV